MDALAVTTGPMSIVGWVLVHSIWQAGLVAIGLALILRMMPESLPRGRSTVAWSALLLVVGLVGGTALVLGRDWGEHARCRAVVSTGAAGPGCAGHGLPTTASTASAGETTTGPTTAGPTTAGPTTAGPTTAGPNGASAQSTRSWMPLVYRLSRPMAFVAWIWGALGLLSAARVLFGLRSSHRLRGRSAPVREGAAHRILTETRERLGVSRDVDLRLTDEVGGPAVVGARAPAILIPGRVLETLAPSQLAAVFAHELIHVRGRHFALNIGQCLAESLFAPNPFVRWISARIREAREAVCDRVAAASSSGGRQYLEALLRLERARWSPAPGSLGLLGEGSLVRRVRRLSRAADPARRIAVRSVLSAILAFAILTVALSVSVTMIGITSWAVMQRDVDDRPAPVPTLSSPVSRRDVPSP